MEPRPARTSALIAGIVLIVLGILAYQVHRSLAFSEPSATTRALFTAAASGDLDAFKKSCTDQFYRAFVEDFGQKRLAVVQTAYASVYRLGLPQWEEVHQRGLRASYETLSRLRERILALGREEFMKQGVDARMRLIEEGQVEQWQFAHGVEALPPEERRMIGNVEALREGRAEISDQVMWNSLAPEDRTALGSAAALSTGNTPEKLAYIDRVGLEPLAKEQRALIGSITRSEIADVPAFKFKYGEIDARAFLAGKRVPTNVTVSDCGFPRADQRGGLLRGSQSHCHVLARVTGTEADLALEVQMRKLGVSWLVDGVEPALSTVRW